MISKTVIHVRTHTVNAKYDRTACGFVYDNSRTISQDLSRKPLNDRFELCPLCKQKEAHA